MDTMELERYHDQQEKKRLEAIRNSLDTARDRLLSAADHADPARLDRALGDARADLLDRAEDLFRIARGKAGEEQAVRIVRAADTLAFLAEALGMNSSPSRQRAAANVVISSLSGIDSDLLLLAREG